MALHRIGALAILLGPGDLTPAVIALLKTLGCTTIAFNPEMKGSQEKQLWAGLKELALTDAILISIRQSTCPPSLKIDPEIYSYQDLLKRGESLGMEDVLIAQAHVKSDDPIVASGTSGTTGNPKLVQLTSHAIVNLQGGVSFKVSNRKITSFVARPIPWIGGLISLFKGLYSESTIVWIPTEIGLSEKTQEVVCEVIQNESCNTWAPNHLFLPKLKALQTKYDLSSVRLLVLTGRRHTPEEMFLVSEAFPNANIIHAYGSSESMKIGMRFQNRETIKDKSSVTKLLTCPGVEVKIVDANNKVVPRGEPGEICCRSECVFLGYLGNLEATSRAKSPQGWLHTEDLGTMDDQGMIEVIGRTSEIIKRATVKIFPGEIKAELLKNPLVADAIVIGVPDQRLHEEICACVVFRKSGSDGLSLDALADWCNEKWPARADGLSLKPKYFVVYDEFPMTRSAKIDLKEVKKIALAKLGLGEK
ncbi:predicted protein [Nematostella vectensis]|uniref:Uncharacterized protein n=3 Tax=Nematostella vectensis TaxID=45351 RepID=A7RYF9_NEMVE|nr:predicted protein [Nematostella vectensis]|eukprot:XP_001635518.1 predicted protein [Nematostella vectensis]